MKSDYTLPIDPYRQAISIIEIWKQDGKERARSVPTYTAIGYAHERADQMLNGHVRAPD